MSMNPTGGTTAADDGRLSGGALSLGFACRGVRWLGIEEHAFRMGATYHAVFACLLIVAVPDIARRKPGWVLSLIICVFTR